MAIKQISIGKELTLNVGNYSNIKPRVDLTYDVADGESVNWGSLWDTVNGQLFDQVEGIDASWIEKTDHKDFWKIVLRIPKTL